MKKKEHTNRKTYKHFKNSNYKNRKKKKTHWRTRNER